jgi:hypothetical protein
MNYKLTSNLELVPSKNNFKWLTYLLVVLLLCTVFAYFFREESVRIIYQVVHPNVENPSQDIELTEEAIVKCLHENGCVLPNIAMAQAKLESNLGKSNVGKNAKNMFGIVYHKCNYITGKYGVYGKYETYADNIKCYIHIQDHYLKNIDGKYAEDPSYTDKIKKIK